MRTNDQGTLSPSSSSGAAAEAASQEAAWSVVWVSNATGAWEFASRDWYALTGMRGGAAEGVGWLEGVCESEREAIQARWNEQRASREPIDLRFHLKGAAGGTRAVVLRGEPSRDRSGEFRGYEGTLVADSDRRQEVQDAWLPHRDYLRAICDSAADGLYVMAPDSRCTYINPAGARMLGYEAAELVGRGLHDIVHHTYSDGRHHPIDECPIAIAARAGATDRIEDDVFWRKDGTPVPVAYGVSPVLLDGAPSGAIVTFQDITHRKNIEATQHARLRSTERERERLAALFDQSPSFAAVLTGAEFRFERANDRYLELIGRREILGKSLAEALPEVVEQGFLAVLREVYESGEPYVGAGVPITLDRGGSAPDDIFVDFVYQPLRDLDGRVTGVFVHGIDQTENRRQLASIAAANLDNARLYEQLREQDRRKDEFLATLAHELRNPLAPIRTGLAVLRANASEDSRRQVRDVIDRQVAHMVRLIDDLLDVSRITSGKVHLQREYVDIQSVVNAALEVSRPAIEIAGHELHVSVSSQRMVVYADRTRIAQAISNLLNNAAKYTPGGGRIDLLAHPQDGSVVVTVRDDGVGLAPEAITQVFDLFTQVGKTLDRAQGGLGIGLALVKRLVEMHGGSVEVQSDGPGAGAAFTLRLPAQQAPAADVAEGDGAATISATAMSILVVDDNVDAATTMAMLLELAGNAVHIAHDGPNAIADAARLRPNLVFLDIGLPGMDGYEVAKSIRATEWGATIGLVALTGWGSAEDRKRALASGFDDHMTKPVDTTQLQAVLAGLGQDERTRNSAGEN